MGLGLRPPRQVSRSHLSDPFLATLPTNLGQPSMVADVHTCENDLHLRPPCAAASLGSHITWKPFGAIGHLYQCMSHLVPPCRALRAALAHDLFLTDGCVALRDPRRS